MRKCPKSVLTWFHLYLRLFGLHQNYVSFICSLWGCSTARVCLDGGTIRELWHAAFCFSQNVSDASWPTGNELRKLWFVSLFSDHNTNLLSTRIIDVNDWTDEEELQIKSYSAGYHSSAASVNYPPRVVKHWFGLKLGNTNGPRVLLAHQ